MSALQSLLTETLPDWVKLTQLLLTAAVAAKALLQVLLQQICAWLSVLNDLQCN